ncbi:MAG: DoxX family protein [Isosphaeraceae bacterium]
MPASVIPPGLLSSRNYPGFLGALLLILLRIAIGWHFLTEGLEKYDSTRYGKSPFSAEVYLRNSTGPFAHYFRDLLPDADSKDLLHTEGKETVNPDWLKANWSELVTRIENHYRFNDEQKKKAQTLLEQSTGWAEVWFNNPDNRQAREKYFHELAEVEKTEKNENALSYERERTWESRRTLEADRKSLIAPIVAQEKDLESGVVALATPEQQASAGEYTRPLSTLDWSNLLTTYGLCAIGICLILGFLTPLAAVSAAVFLAMLYLAIPPWKGLPPIPIAEGHYWIVNKNLVEMIACLLLAVTASGYWLGLDRLVFGARRRRRWDRYERRLAEKYGLVLEPAASTDHDRLESVPLASGK